VSGWVTIAENADWNELAFVFLSFTPHRDCTTMTSTSTRPWLGTYPEGVPADIPVGQYRSLVQLLEDSFRQHAQRTAYSFMGKDITYAETDSLSEAIAAYLQSLGLTKGDRVALMMPNVPQYPVAVAAVLRAGLVVVNVNPLYTPRELEHQLNDSGAKAIFILENFAHTLAQCLTRTDVRHVILTAMGDRLGLLKGSLVNHVVRHVKKMVPAYQLPQAVRFNEALARGTRLTLKRPDIRPDAVVVAVLETAGIDLIDDRFFPPGFLQGRGWRSEYGHIVQDSVIRSQDKKKEK
jgi:long-chain acyl-CoA synthetase